MASRPNLLILMLDQLRADCAGAGHPIVRTPHIDRLAGEGLRCTHAYTTSPICMPARSSFLSGLYCHNHGQWDNHGHLPVGTDTFALRARDAGYHTCHIGKSHYYQHERGRHLNEFISFLQALGWTDVLETTGPHATRWANSIMTDHWATLGCLETFRDDYARRAACGEIATWPSPLPPGETMDDFVGHTAVEYLERYDDDAPFLTFVGFGGPHEPWDPPADWAAQYDPAAMDPATPVAEPGPWVPERAAAFQRQQQAPNPKLPPQKIAEIRARYYAKISHIDAWIGRILETLEARGQLENTAICLWSDHGEMLGDKQRIHKTVFYEASARVPLIIRPAGGMAPRTYDGLVSILDAAPTLLQMAGCEAPGFGVSLAPALAGDNAPVRDAVCSEILDRTMIRDGRYKLTVNTAGDALELYDLQQDPGETVNLVGHPDAAAAETALRTRLLAWHLETADHQAGHLPEVACVSG